MGECSYYFKAKFQTPKAAQTALPSILNFLAEGKRAEDWWQDHRGTDHKIFWSAFEEEFPQVTEYLKQAKLFGIEDCSNGLAGNLDMVGSDENLEIFRDGSVLSYDSGEIWHLATWNHLEEYLCKRFPIVRFVWNTEESIGNLNSLELYDWKKIVQDLLKKGDPVTLLGINKDLDELLEERLKTRKEKHA